MCCSSARVIVALSAGFTFPSHHHSFPSDLYVQECHPLPKEEDRDALFFPVGEKASEIGFSLSCLHSLFLNLYVRLLLFYALLMLDKVSVNPLFPSSGGKVQMSFRRSRSRW